VDEHAAFGLARQGAILFGLCHLGRMAPDRFVIFALDVSVLRQTGWVQMKNRLSQSSVTASVRVIISKK
jgi:hypothetical protein